MSNGEPQASTAKFPLGRTVITNNALNTLTEDDVLHALVRHANGDWGNLCEEDVRENELSLEKGFRLFSVYNTEDETKFYVITEADRSITTVLLPEDY